MSGSDSCLIQETLAQLEAGVEKPFGICERLADTVAAIMETDTVQAEACLAAIEAAHAATQHNAVKLALENCFLFQLGNRIFPKADRQRLLDMLPRNLHDMLMRQMLAPGP